ncbi:MAG: response regulator [Myxococcales bacterium]|nr:response regulator [Myxococcales bacterium]
MDEGRGVVVEGTVEWLLAAHERFANCAQLSSDSQSSVDSIVDSLLRAMCKSFSWHSSWLLGPFEVSALDEIETTSYWSVHAAGVDGQGREKLILGDEVAYRIQQTRLDGAASHHTRRLVSGESLGREVRLRLVGRAGRDWILGLQSDGAGDELDEFGCRSFSSLGSRLCEILETSFLARDLDHSRALETAVWQRSKQGLILVSADGACLRANSAASRLVGRPEKEMTCLAAREWLPAPLDITMSNTANASWKGQLGNGNGEGRSVDITQSQILCLDDTLTLFQLIDCTDYTALEGQLEQLQRHRLVGRLSSGVVHDLNNLLTVIVAALEGAERDPDHSSFPEMLSDAHEAVRRCESLCRQLLTMGRRRHGRVRVVQPDPTIAGIRKLMERTVPDDSEFSLSLMASGACVALPAGALEQILLSLLVNASEVMPEQGAISVATGIEGNRFILSVSDQGQGIDEATLQRVFEPLYAAKEPHGSAKGLAVVQGLVAQVGGQIEVQSSPGKGARFDVSFTLASEETVMFEKSPTPGYDRSKRGEGKVVLLCENEPVLRDVIQRSLSEHGYEVVGSSDGCRGLELIEGGVGVDAVVTDLVMPRVGGAEIAKACNRGDRRTPVVFVSGLLERGALPELDAPTQYLAKPFRMQDLLGALQAVLGESVALHPAV